MIPDQDVVIDEMATLEKDDEIRGHAARQLGIQPTALSGEALVAHGERVALVSREGAVSYAELSALPASGSCDAPGLCRASRGARLSGRAHDEAVGLAGS